jgi:hypothetical protein
VDHGAADAEQHTGDGLMGRGLSSESKDLIKRIYAVFEEEHPNSPRRVAYALFGNKAGAMASKIGGLCGRMLDAGELPLEWYDDSSRAEVEPYVAETVDSFIAMGRDVPPIDPWLSQPVYAKVWSEKSIGGTLVPVLQALSVPFLNTKGWNSRPILMRQARRTQHDPRRLVILYCGDHDAAGLRMSNVDLPRRLEKYHARNVEIRRIAITRTDFDTMRRRGLTDPMKEKDPNKAWYLRTTGLRVGVELETLPAPVVRDCVEQAIKACIEDVPAWNRAMETSRTVRASWQEYVDQWPRPQIAIGGLDHKYEGEAGSGSLTRDDPRRESPAARECRAFSVTQI